MREGKDSFSLAKNRMAAVKIPIIEETNTTEKKMSIDGGMWSQRRCNSQAIKGKDNGFNARWKFDLSRLT